MKGDKRVEDREMFALFGTALGLSAPWQVGSVEFDKDAGELQIGLEFPRASRFACPEKGCTNAECPVHDTLEKRWRHLDFFQHQAYLAARVPRVKCAEHGVHLVEVAWARPGSGFTLLMEMAMLTYARQMPIAPLAKMAREHDTRIWRVVEHYVNTARASLDFSEVTQVGMEETSARRGQDYVSIFMDLSEHRVMFATPGRDSDTVKAFAADLESHGGQPKTQLEALCCDMSAAFVKGIGDHLAEQATKPQAGGDVSSDQMATLAAGSTQGPPSKTVQIGEGEIQPTPVPHCPTIIFDRYHV
ncbi:MAG: transposase, partial [Terriglobia bacterium]